jgi:hypothetical protein
VTCSSQPSFVASSTSSAASAPPSSKPLAFGRVRCGPTSSPRSYAAVRQASMRPHVSDSVYLAARRHRRGASRVLFEGANACLLGHRPRHVPVRDQFSNCSTLGIPAGTGVPGSAPSAACYGIMKAYSARAWARGRSRPSLINELRRPDPGAGPRVRHHHRAAASLRLARPGRGALFSRHGVPVRPASRARSSTC